MVVCRPGRCHCQCGVELWSIPFFKWRRRQSQVATKRVPCQANSQFRYLLAREFSDEHILIVGSGYWRGVEHERPVQTANPARE